MENQIPNQDPTIQQPTEPVITPSTPTPEIEITPEPEITPELQPQPEPVLPPRPEMEITPEPQPQSTEQQLQDLGIATPSKTGGGFLKGLFVFALIIFILVISALGLAYFKSQNKSSTTDDLSSTISPTLSPSMVCSLNDKIYKVGESFASADGCNICTCESSDVIICTEKACATPTTATKSATTSTIPKDWKTYINKDYGFSLNYPKELALTETNNETKILAAEKTKTYQFYFTEIGTRTFSVKVWNNVSNYTLDQANKYLAQNSADIVPDDQLTGFSDKINYTLGGIKGIRGKDGCCGTIRDNVLVIKGKYIYVVSYSKGESDTTDQTATFEKIISSFKFN